jgi:hypothetical protein
MRHCAFDRNVALIVCLSTATCRIIAVLNAYFVGPTGIKTQASTEESIVIERNRIKLSPGEEAVHERHTLVWQGKTHIVLRIESPAVVYYERGSERSPEFGPFPVLTMVDGMLMTNLDAESPLVRFEFTTKAWLDPSTMIVWDRVIIASRE